MILASTFLGKLAGTDGVFLGLIAFVLFIFTFPDDNWQRMTRPFVKPLAIAAGILSVWMLFFGLLSIWGVH